MPRLLSALFARARVKIRLRFHQNFPIVRFALAEARCKWLSRWKLAPTAKAKAYSFIIGCLVLYAGGGALLRKLRERKGAKNAKATGRVRTRVFPVQAVTGWERYKGLCLKFQARSAQKF